MRRIGKESSKLEGPIQHPHRQQTERKLADWGLEISRRLDKAPKNIKEEPTGGISKNPQKRISNENPNRLQPI